MEKVKVSVIIPVWNAEKTVKETLDSVINQTYKNLEIIVVDDCSTDSSLSILNDYAKCDSRIIVVHNEKNLKVSESRNAGFKRASGKYIAFIDSDDIWPADKLEKQIAFMEENNYQLTYTGAYFIDDNGNRVGNDFVPRESVNFKQLLKQNIITMSSACILADIAKKHPMHHSELHEDFIFWLEILKSEVKTAYLVKDVLIAYRLTTGSKSRNKFKSMVMTYKTYRKAGINFFAAHWYLMFYIVNGLKKYKNTK